MSIANALAFVREHGDSVAQARLARLLQRVSPATAVVEQLFANQRPDGGWAPFWAPDYSSLDATCFRLAQAEALGLVPSAPAADRALQFLGTRQAADGSWNETPPAGTVLPPWLAPEQPGTTCYLSANCGFWLSQSPAARRAVERAAGFLKGQCDDGQLPGPLHGAWLAIGVWQATGDHRSRHMAEAYLQQRVSTLSASNLAWALTCFTIAGVEHDGTLYQDMASRLRALQHADGGWPSDDGAKGGVHTTLEALRVLLAETFPKG